MVPVPCSLQEEERKKRKRRRRKASRWAEAAVPAGCWGAVSPRTGCPQPQSSGDTHGSQCISHQVNHATMHQFWQHFCHLEQERGTAPRALTAQF